MYKCIDIDIDIGRNIYLYTYIHISINTYGKRIMEVLFPWSANDKR